MLKSTSAALKSVFLNGLECTRLPWDILGTNGAPECQGTAWGVSPGGGGLVPPWATSVTSSNLSNTSSNLKPSSEQLDGQGPYSSMTSASSSSGLSSGTLQSPGGVTPSDAERAVRELLSRSPWSALGSWHQFEPAAASQMMSCMSHYCCGLQVIETLGVVSVTPGAGKSDVAGSGSSGGDEPVVSAANGPPNGSKGPEMVSFVLLHQVGNCRA